MTTLWHLNTHHIITSCFYDDFLNSDMIDRIIEAGDKAESQSAKIGAEGINTNEIRKLLVPYNLYLERYLVGGTTHTIGINFIN